jgi:hypothetical protein
MAFPIFLFFYYYLFSIPAEKSKNLLRPKAEALSQNGLQARDCVDKLCGNYAIKVCVA